MPADAVLVVRRSAEHDGRPQPLPEGLVGHADHGKAELALLVLREIQSEQLTLRDLVPADLAAVIPMRALAEAFMNLSYGLAMRRLVDPSVTAESMLKPLREALRSLGLLPD